MVHAVKMKVDLSRLLAGLLTSLQTRSAHSSRTRINLSIISSHKTCHWRSNLSTAALFHNELYCLQCTLTFNLNIQNLRKQK